MYYSIQVRVKTDRKQFELKDKQTQEEGVVEDTSDKEINTGLDDDIHMEVGLSICGRYWCGSTLNWFTQCSWFVYCIALFLNVIILSTLVLQIPLFGFQLNFIGLISTIMHA